MPEKEAQSMEEPPGQRHLVTLIRFQVFRRTTMRSMRRKQHRVYLRRASRQATQVRSQANER